MSLFECNPSFYEKIDYEKTRCVLCHNFCVLKKSEVGKCSVRKNINGKMFLVNYGEVASCVVDTTRKRPIENMEEMTSLTIGLTGCSNTCPFCQNYMITQDNSFQETVSLSTESITGIARQKNVSCVSFSLSEPIVWIEFLRDASKKCKEEGFKTCLKTAGNINKKFYGDLLEYIDIVNIDVKPYGLTKECGIHDENEVFNLIKFSYEKGIHTEISYMVIDGVNNYSFSWLRQKMEELKNVHINLLKHHPCWKSYKFSVTSDQVLNQFLRDCKSSGLERVSIFKG